MNIIIMYVIIIKLFGLCDDLSTTTSTGDTLSSDPVVTYGYTLSRGLQPSDRWNVEHSSVDGRRIGKNGSVKVKYLYVYRKTHKFSFDFPNEFGINGQNVNYELYEDGSKARYTHPIASGGCSGGCGGASNVFTDHP
ncbi:MAG: hypothetical protein R6U61_09425, partial [Thermoplasmata archaeon]